MVKKILNVVSTVIVVFAVAFAVLTVGVRIAGFKPYAILSGSMTPTYQVGDMVYVRQKPFNEIKKGDAITFMSGPDIVVTHRVAEVNETAQFFRTKGDANQFVDGNPVQYQNVIGVVAFSVPKLGRLSAALAKPSGKFMLIAIIAILLLILLLPLAYEAFKEDAEKKKQKAQETATSVEGKKDLPEQNDS